EIDKRICDFTAAVVSYPGGVPFHVAHQAFQVVAGAGNAHHSQCRTLPGLAWLHLRNRNVEVRPQPILDAAHHLAFVFERVRAFNADLEREIRNHFPSHLHDVPVTDFSQGEISSGTTVRFVLYEGFGRYPLGHEVLDDIPDFDIA